MQLAVTSGTLLTMAAGTLGTSDGTVLLTADGQTLPGKLWRPTPCAITPPLQSGSTLTRAIDADGPAGPVNLTPNASSPREVTEDSSLSCLNDAYVGVGSTIANITGNGCTVFYDPCAYAALGGSTCALAGGGELTPARPGTA